MWERQHEMADKIQLISSSEDIERVWLSFSERNDQNYWSCDLSSSEDEGSLAGIWFLNRTCLKSHTIFQMFSWNGFTAVIEV